MAEDQFNNSREGLESPADNVIDIDAEKDDATDLTFVIRGLHVGGGGVVRGILNGETTERDFTVNAGALYPYRFKRIFSTGTTATGLLGVF